jgi:hypothetical protein
MLGSGYAAYASIQIGQVGKLFTGTNQIEN